MQSTLSSSAEKDVGRLLVRELARLVESIKERFDCIVPVPVSASRLKERGFNQSFIIAEEISRITGKTVLTSVLLKTRETEDQYRLEKERRKENVKGVFAARNTAKIKNQVVLLVDDLLTTGYTAQEAARILLKAKVRDVVFFGLARTP
jgi:Predicted amidophosphoribosyltransferases